MSGLPICLHSWIGACFSEYTGKIIGKDDFISLWTRKVGNTEKSLKTAEEKWGLLVSFAGRSAKIVSMDILRQILGRKQPPAEFCYREIGLSWPIISTIHASKGREAEEVCLLLPGNPGPDSDFDEESRVIYVGATRAKSRLHIGSGFIRLFSKRLPKSGRAFTLDNRENSPRAHVEIGRDGDIAARGVAGPACYSSPEIIRKNQKLLKSLAGKITPAFAVSDHTTGHIYRLKAGDHPEGTEICCLSESLNADLFDVGREIQVAIGGKNRRTPDELKYLRIYGIRSLVLPPDSPECGRLFEPWSESGIMLAPVILGYPKAFFRYY